MNMKFSVPCLFGLEGLVSNELKRLGAPEVMAENGRVRFSGTAADMAGANIGLRCGERVLLELGRFRAETFDGLFEGVKALPWEDYIPRDGRFPVKGFSLDSALHSVPDCQRIIKKASAVRLGQKYGLNSLPETGQLYQIQFSLMKDEAVIYLDTTGPGLHKRGYRPENAPAPLRETLAAALVTLSRYRGRELFCDPFCGSGTIAIEAALMAKNRAPGLMRPFAAERWALGGKRVFDEARERARAGEFNGDYRILASDIDPAAVSLARKCAARAGVGPLIQTSVADARQFSTPTENGILAANPPYGERLLERGEAQALCRDFGRAMGALSGWRAYILSSDPEFERLYGRPADKKRKLYNGMIKCDLYMYTK